jgi:hypothetical protein
MATNQLPLFSDQSQDLPLCACGCGEPVRKSRGGWNKFINGHVWKGRKKTEEHKRHIGLSNKGKAGFKGKDNPNWGGKLCTPEWREKQSKAHKDQKATEETRRKLSIAGTGRKHSDETKARMSKAQSGEKNAMFGKYGELNPNYGNKYTDEQLLKMMGPNHWNWQGGKTNDQYCDAWNDPVYKQDIKKRDGNACMSSGCRHNSDNLPMHIHHIDYDKKNCHFSNLITVCNSCNARANFNRDEWTIFYRDILKAKYGYKY